jgi:hypothetical protein
VNALLAEARAKTDAENAVVNEKRTLAATSGERRRSVHSALKRVENEQKELEARSAMHTVELGEIDIKIGGCANRRRRSRTGSREPKRKNCGARRARGCDREVTTAREAADAMSVELADLNHRSADALNERAAIEVRQAEAVTQLKNVNEKCAQDLNTSLSSLIESEVFEEDFDLGRVAIEPTIFAIGSKDSAR